MTSPSTDQVTQQEPRSEAVSALPEGRGEPRCHVCSSRFRESIDLALADPATSAVEVAARFAGISERSVRRHRRGRHRRLYEGEPRAIAGRGEARIEAQGDDIVDAVRLGREVLSQTWERLAEGQIRPTLQDAYRFARIVAEYSDTEKEVLDRDLVTRYFWAMVQVSEQHMNGNQRAYRQAINANVDIQTMFWIVSGKTLEEIPNEGDD